MIEAVYPWKSKLHAGNYALTFDEQIMATQLVFLGNMERVVSQFIWYFANHTEGYQLRLHQITI